MTNDPVGSFFDGLADGLVSLAIAGRQAENQRVEIHNQLYRELRDINWDAENEDSPEKRLVAAVRLYRFTIDDRNVQRVHPDSRREFESIRKRARQLIDEAAQGLVDARCRWYPNKTRSQHHDDVWKLVNKLLNP